MHPWRDVWRRGIVAIIGGQSLAIGARDRVAVERLPPFESRILGKARTIDVFLPRGYARDSTINYPVLYANDGQDMETVELRVILDSLQRTGAMAPVIVVAIHATDRMHDYGTAGVPNAQGRGSRAELYSQFLLQELMPAIEQRYRVATGPAHTAAMGWSLGGLSLFDLAWRHPERIGAVGVFSGSFWSTPDASAQAAVGRPLAQIAAQPKFIVAVLSGAISYGVMNFLMTSTPIAMGVCGHPYGDAAFVISSHVIAMFAPSFVTGSLIKRFGVLTVMFAGALLNFAAIAVALSGIAVAQFWWSLVLLSVGWNCMYVGATALLTETYRPEEMAKAQGANEQAIFIVMAISSFTSGLTVTQAGWELLARKR